MNRADLIAQVELDITRLEKELNAAKTYLGFLKGDSTTAQIQDVKKGNQTLEARKKMQIAQQRRQERERKERFQKIESFLNDNSRATTKEIANMLGLSLGATRRHLRLLTSVEEIGTGLWKKAQNK